VLVSSSVTCSCCGSSSTSSSVIRGAHTCRYPRHKQQEQLHACWLPDLEGKSLS
jgi:hypothetical protein